MTLKRIAAALGGEVVNVSSVLCPGPGHSRHDRSLMVTFQPDGSFTTHSFAADNWKVCKDYVTRILGGGIQSVLTEEAMKPRFDGVDFALQIWREAVPVHPILLQYLATRGLQVKNPPAHSIRFHPRCPWGAGVTVPAMIGLFRDIRSDEPCGIHRTALKPDGTGKAVFPDGRPAKKMLGRSKEAAIKLSDDSEVLGGLAVAEGIETAMTILFSGYAPVWAMGSAGAIERLPILGGVESLAVFADYDDAGLAAARSCGRRWADEGREVLIARPHHLRTDWNDVVRGAAS